MDPFWPVSDEEIAEQELAQQEEVELKASKHVAEVSEAGQDRSGQFVSVVEVPSPDERDEGKDRQGGERRVRFDTDKITMKQYSERQDSQESQGRYETGDVYIIADDQTHSYPAGTTLMAVNQLGHEQTEWGVQQANGNVLAVQAVQTQPAWLIEMPASEPQHGVQGPTLVHTDQGPTLLHASQGATLVQTSQGPALMHADPGMYDMGQGYAVQAGPEAQEEYVLYVTEEPTEEAAEEKRSSGWCC